MHNIFIFLTFVAIALENCEGILREYRSVLYVWSGQNSSVPNAADFVAVVDFDSKSPTYGRILKTVPLVNNPEQNIGQIGNEPHHSRLSANKKLYITGGLLSFLKGNREVFVWKVPKKPSQGPKFWYAMDVPAACPDEFVPVSGPVFVVSMMCNEQAVSPGNMVHINAQLKIARPIITDFSSVTGLNPHGFSRLSNGSLLVADYIQPASLLAPRLSDVIFRNTNRHILPNGKIERTFEFQLPSNRNESTGVGQGIGFMELKAIPGDPYSRAYTCGTNANLMYLIGPGMAKPIVALDLSQVNGYVKVISAGLSSMFPDGKRMLVTFQMRFVILLNITKPETPNILRVFDFCTDSAVKDMIIQVPDSNQNTTFAQFCANNNNVVGTHAVIHPDEESRFVVLNYFLKFGWASFPGTRTMHAFKLNQDLTDFEYDFKFNPNFQFNGQSAKQHPTFHSLQAFPHHAQYLRF